VIEIDGSYGEGGGQVLRTALTLSVITGQAVHLRLIRAGRRNPGLQPQHLTGVLALAKVCAAELRGAGLKSTEIVFAPQSKPRMGEYEFDVAAVAQGGSAGSVILIAQTLLLPLAFAGGPSHLTLMGGTHVPWSPSFHYLAHVYLPMVARMGLRAEAKLEAWGFYPVGGGRVTVSITPTPDSPPLTGNVPTGEGPGMEALALLSRGPLNRVWGTGVAANLPAHIPQRIVSRTRNLLAEGGVRAEITPVRERAAGPGAGLFLVAEYEHTLAGFSSIGEKGKPSEQVAEEAALDLLAHHRSGEPVDMHLADQLLLPMALASGRSEFRTCRITQHLLTNAHIIQQFLPVRIEIEGEEHDAGRVVVNPSPV
jgi:RNA 3'-terminal phosphate cyclase (ATP)